MRGHMVKGTFYRTDEIGRDRSECPSWLEDFAEKLMISEAKPRNHAPKNAVEVARQRMQSVFEQISSIMSPDGKSKFSAVEDVVKDYQKRTGLADFANNKLNMMAKHIIEASEADQGKKKV